ncbi:T9SS type A sorting domain-containing protein [Moheibacter lacus]|uniref:T9SS type A sorting domain-containing protein n=1 Tax=Moheibacter lacus TaxID=2745851 RepID=A0A838ZJ17_9FLAO|nr:T9SS type A sorting domain-containing protein [Moheibacter lacus]MBA5629641.1 T9SS type A sorting domain-containing protein [Moheibacter lacus]
MKNNFLLFFSVCFLAFSQLFGQDIYTQITTTDELTSGEYLIVGDGSTNDGFMLNQQNAGGHSTYILHTAVTDPGTTISSGFTSDNVFTIDVNSGQITIYNAEVGYVTYRGSGNHASFYDGTPENTEKWTYSVDAGLWSLTNVDNTDRILQWNNSSPRFAAYTSSQVKLKLYKKETEEPTGFSISVIQPTGGSISPEGVVEVEEGGTATFTATAESDCFVLSHWVVDGANAGNTNPYVFTNVTADHTITAVFNVASTYTVTPSAGPNGQISPNTAQTVNCGGDINFVFIPDPGYEVADVLVDGVSVGNMTSYTITNVTEDHTISVSFEEIAEPGDFCMTENFENIPTSQSTFYQTRTWTGNDGIEWSATDARTDQTITDRALGMRNSTLTNTSTISGGIGTLSFDYKRIYSNNSTLKVFVNGTQYGGDITVSEETPTTFSTDINVTGDVVIEIINSGNRTAIDNLGWTCPEEPCETPLPTAETQTFCGTTTVADLVAEGTELKWYDSLEATTPLAAAAEIATGTYYVTQTIDCESEKLAVEITVNEIPDAPTADAQELCDGATVADLVAVGTDLNWYETEDATEPLEEDVLLVSGNYFVSQTVNGCESERLSVEITINVAPVFTTQPEDQTAILGQNATFSSELEAEGSFQWYVSTDNGANWTIIDAATENNYTTEATTFDMDGYQFRVVATNDCGETTSNAAILTVIEEPCGGMEDFETTDIPATYGDGSFTNNGITWTYGHSRNEGSGTGDDYSIDGKGLMLRRASDSYLETTLTSGVGEFSFEYRKAFTGGNERQLELIVNGTQVATTEVFGDESGEDPTVHTFSFTINFSGETVIRIKNVGETTSNRQTVIDNISWTCTAEPCTTPMPTADAQTFCGTATVADLMAEGTDLKWYDSLEATEPLASDLELVSGTYYVSQTIDCESERLAVEVTVNEIPAAPIAVGNFEFVAGETLADLEDSLEFTGELTWYDDEELTIVLPDTTLLEDAGVYYVTQTIDGCESEALRVETEELGLSSSELANFSFYPNPVKEVMNLKNASSILQVEIYNLAGKLVYTKSLNAKQAALDLSQLSSGVYVMKITTENQMKTIKILKK